MNKYRNVKRNGFDSAKEARRYNVLAMLQAEGKISDLKKQVKFELIPSQRISGRVIERACHYIADFTYYENGVYIVEDVKGYTRKNPEYIIKRKLMLYKYGIRIKET